MENITSDVPKEKKNIFKKCWTYWKYINVEPFLFFYIMPSMFNAVAIQNFPLQKACQVNFNYTQIVCETILDKDELGIDCDEFDFQNVTQLGSGILWNVTKLSPDFNYTVCKAERDAVIFSATVNTNRQSICAIFPFVLVLLAAGWSDLYRKHKFCLMIPLIGEGLSFFALFISAIFFDTIPMEFGGYVEGLVPAMFGGLTFILMAVYSYITSATPEPDRVFRYGIFSIFVSCVPFIGLPFSGVIFQKLGYVYCFAISWIFQVIAFLYVLFFIEELKPEPKTKESFEGTDNLAFEMTDGTSVDRNREVIAAVDEAISNEIRLIEREPCLIEFFDPTLILSCLKMPLEKRPNHGRALLIAMFVAYFLTTGPASGESDYWYKYTLIKLNWNGNDYSIYNTFSTSMTIVGTFIGTAILSKILKISPAMIGIISALCIVLSRPLFAFARESIMFYTAGVIEMFVSLRVIAIRAIAASIVDGDELGRMFAILSICEPIGQSIFPPLYAYVYSNAVNKFPGAIFLFGEIFFLPNVIVFIFCFILFKKQNKKKEALENGASNGASKDKQAQNGEPQTEISSL